MTPAGKLIRQAADIVDGARNTQHGNKERSFECIAEFWSIYIRHRHAKYIGRSVPSHCDRADVAAMMILMKIARYLHGAPIADHFIDMAGYAGILGELEGALEEETTNVKADEYHDDAVAGQLYNQGP